MFSETNPLIKRENYPSQTKSTKPPMTFWCMLRESNSKTLKSSYHSTTMLHFKNISIESLEKIFNSCIVLISIPLITNRVHFNFFEVESNWEQEALSLVLISLRLIILSQVEQNEGKKVPKDLSWLRTKFL